MKPVSVVCAGVSKRFGEVEAVGRLDLVVPSGQIMAVLGPSGCGKTTLLRLIAGFERPDQGTIEVNGRLVSDGTFSLPPEERRVGMVFQNFALFPHLTVTENIRFGLSEAQESEVREKVDHWLRLIGLQGYGNRYPHELSGGESQRVAIARALAPEPVILLMDEPFSNLDADRRVRIRDEIRFLLRQAQATVVFVTHDQEEALFMGDLLGVMWEGRIAQVGPAEAVFQEPVSRPIAEFLGHAEFLPGTVANGDVLTEIGALGQRVNLAEGTEIEVGFRADDVTFDPDRDGAGLILARFFRGTTNLYRIRLPSGRIIHSMQPHYSALSPGTPVRVRFEANHPLPLFQDGKGLSLA